MRPRREIVAEQAEPMGFDWSKPPRPEDLVPSCADEESRRKRSIKPSPTPFRAKPRIDQMRFKQLLVALVPTMQARAQRSARDSNDRRVLRDAAGRTVLEDVLETVEPIDFVVFAAVLVLCGARATGELFEKTLTECRAADIAREVGVRNDVAAESCHRLKRFGALNVRTAEGPASVPCYSPALEFVVNTWADPRATRAQFPGWLRQLRLAWPTLLLVGHLLQKDFADPGQALVRTRQQLADQLNLGLRQVDRALREAWVHRLLVWSRTGRATCPHPLLSITLTCSLKQGPETGATMGTADATPWERQKGTMGTAQPNHGKVTSVTCDEQMPTMGTASFSSSADPEAQKCQQGPAVADPSIVVLDWLRERARSPGRLTGEQVLELLRALDPDTSAIRVHAAVDADNRRASERIARWAGDPEILAKWILVVHGTIRPRSLVRYLRRSSAGGDPTTLLRQHQDVRFPPDIEVALRGDRMQDLEDLTTQARPQLVALPQVERDQAKIDQIAYALVRGDQWTIDEVADELAITPAAAQAAVERQALRLQPLAEPRRRGRTATA